MSGLAELEASNGAADGAFGSRPAGDAVSPCSSHGFLHARLVDDAGRPLSNVPCTLELGDGSRLDRVLDANGELYEEGVEPGRFRILVSGDAARDPREFLHVCLVDEDGEPLAGRRCSVELPDGTRLERTLDEQGELFEEGVPGGACRVTLVEEETP